MELQKYWIKCQSICMFQKGITFASKMSSLTAQNREKPGKIVVG